LNSKVNTLGVNVAEVSIGSYYPWVVKDYLINVGGSLNVRHLTIFDDTFQVKEFEEMDQDQFQTRLENSTETYVTANIDVGAVYDHDLEKWGDVSVGAVVKDLIPQSFESAQGNDIKFSPKVRVGVAHNTYWSSVMLDIDLTKNEALGYGVDTQYVSIGGEVKAGKHVALRTGYKTNLAVDDDHVVSFGVGVTPFGVGVDVSAWVKPTYDEESDNGISGGIATKFAMRF
jgi:hypothetical protein